MLFSTAVRAGISGAVLFALAGCAAQTSSTSARAPAASAARSLPEGVTLAMVTVGDSIFKKGSCQRCHGMDGKGNERGPNLTDSEWAQIGGSYAEIVNIVTVGVAKEKVKMPNAPFGMRARGGINLTDEQVRQVSAYVYSLSHP